MKYIAFIALACLAICGLSAAPAGAQDADVVTYQLKAARVAEIGPQPSTPRGLVWPTSQTATRGSYFGFRLVLGALYDPIAFPSDTWINIACMSQDPRVKWSSTFGSNSYVYVHAIIYEQNLDGSLNTDTAINTFDTTESDEGICNLAYGLDSSFIEIPRTFNAAVVTLLSGGGTGQYVEVVESVERMIVK